MIQSIKLRAWCCLILGVVLFPTFAKGPATPLVIEQYYEAMTRIQNTSNEREVYDLTQKMCYSFVHGNPRVPPYSGSGVRLPNDIVAYTDDGRQYITSTLYCTNLTSLLKSKGLKVSVSIKNSRFCTEADLPGYRNENTPFIATEVSKTFVKGNKKTICEETIISQDNLIHSIKSSQYSVSVKDIASLRADAALYYTLGMYKDAYDAYKQILAQNPDDANAYYRLGILAFWYGKKCGLLSSKEREKQGMEYMEKASRLGANRASTVLNYMKNGISV